MTKVHYVDPLICCFQKQGGCCLVYVGICASDFPVKGFVEGHGWSV